MRIDRLVAIAAAAGLIAGCDQIPGTGGPEVRTAEQIISAPLRDPGSAQFRNVAYHPANGPWPAGVCGEVNAKNGFGGYVGFHRFAVNLNKGTGSIEQADELASGGGNSSDFSSLDFPNNWFEDQCGSSSSPTSSPQATTVATPADDAANDAARAAKAAAAAEASAKAALAAAGTK
jgi:hypothetical protein